MLFKPALVLHQVYDPQLNHHTFLLLYGMFVNTANPLYSNISFSFRSQNFVYTRIWDFSVAEKT